MYKQLYQFYTQNHRYRFVSVKIPAACGERQLNRCPVLPPSAFVKTYPSSRLGESGKQKAHILWNRYSRALSNRCIYDTWTKFPATTQPSLFSHNSSLHPCFSLAKLRPSSLGAPGLNPNWLGKQNALSSEPLSPAPIWPRLPWQVSPS